MKRILGPVSIAFLSISIGGCTSSQQRLQEQQELERSIQKTSDPEAVKGCSFIMNLRPDGLHSTPEAQAASLVIAKQGVSWVVFGSSSNYELYSCSQKTSRTDQEAKASTPTPVETKPAAGTSAPVAAAAKEEPEAKIKPPDQTKTSGRKTRITNNPEAVKGCKFLESFVEYESVLRFQEDVVRVGGNVGYVVATKQNGDVIGESYSCSETAAQ